MSESFEKEVTTQLREIREELKGHGLALAKIEQKELNGEKQEARQHAAKIYGLTLYRTLMGLGLLLLALDRAGII